MSEQRDQSSPFYIPVPGDVVRIVEVHPDDAYYGDATFIGRELTTASHCPTVTGKITAWGDGWIAFDTVDDQGLTDVFYMVRVELVRRTPVPVEPK